MAFLRGMPLTVWLLVLFVHCHVCSDDEWEMPALPRRGSTRRRATPALSADNVRLALAPDSVLVDDPPQRVNTTLWSCLRQTTPSLRLYYPEDAEAHFQQIHDAMAPWAQPPDHKPHTYANFSGPWVENVWISHFRGAWRDRQHSNPNATLADIFGPFIPLFLTWVDTWFPLFRYPSLFLQTLARVCADRVGMRLSAMGSAHRDWHVVRQP